MKLTISARVGGTSKTSVHADGAVQIRAQGRQPAAETATSDQATAAFSYDAIIVDTPLSLDPRASAAPDNR